MPLSSLPVFIVFQPSRESTKPAPAASGLTLAGAIRITGKTSKKFLDAPVNSRRLLSVLVTLGCLLPIVLAVVLGVARLLAAMQDASGAAVLDRIALAAGILWAVDLVALVLVLGINALPPEG